MENVQVRFIIPKEEYQQKADFLQKGNLEVSPPESIKTAENATLVDAKFVELVAVFAIGTVAAMAVRLFDLAIQQHERGTIIDLTKDPPESILVSNVPYGTVVVKDKKGSQVLKIDPNKTTDTIAIIAEKIANHAQNKGK